MNNTLDFMNDLFNVALQIDYKMNAEVCTTCHISAETRCLTSKSNVYFYNKKNHKDYSEMDKDECIHEH